MGYYKNEHIKELNKERDKIAKEDLHEWDKEQLVQFLYAIKENNFEAFFEGYMELKRIMRGD